MTRRCVRLWIATVTLGLAACGGDDAPDPPIESMIGAAGGSLASANGEATVTVPAGALASDTAISVEGSSVAAPMDAVTVSSAFLFGPEGQTFAVPVTVTLQIDASRIPSGKAAADVKIYTAAGGTTTYQSVTTRVVDATHVAADTSHFSTFVAGVANGGGSNCTVTYVQQQGSMCILRRACPEGNVNMACTTGANCNCYRLSDGMMVQAPAGNACSDLDAGKAIGASLCGW